MAIIREILPHEYHKAYEIDVSETGTRLYRIENGQMVEFAKDWRRPAWSEAKYQGLIDCWKEAVADGGKVLGAFDGDRLVGEVVFRPRLSEGMAQLESLHISTAYRRQGLARALSLEVIRLARETGHRELYVSAAETESAVGFYWSLGFRPTATPNQRLFELEPADIHMTMPL